MARRGIVSAAIQNAYDANTDDMDTLVGAFVPELCANGTLSQAQFAHGLAQALTDFDDQAVDNPLAWSHLAFILERWVDAGIITLTSVFRNPPEAFAMSTYAGKVVLQVCDHLRTHNGEPELRRLWKEAALDLSAFYFDAVMRDRDLERFNLAAVLVEGAAQ